VTNRVHPITKGYAPGGRLKGIHYGIPLEGKGSSVTQGGSQWHRRGGQFSFQREIGGSKKGKGGAPAFTEKRTAPGEKGKPRFRGKNCFTPTASAHQEKRSLLCPLEKGRVYVLRRPKGLAPGGRDICLPQGCWKESFVGQPGKTLSEPGREEGGIKVVVGEGERVVRSRKGLEVRRRQEGMIPF